MVKKAQQSKSSAAAAKEPKAKQIAKPDKPDLSIAQRLKQKSGPKFDLAKLAMNQYLSMTSYMTVLNIKNLIAVRNQHGNTM